MLGEIPEIHEKDVADGGKKHGEQAQSAVCCPEDQGENKRQQGHGYGQHKGAGEIEASEIFVHGSLRSAGIYVKKQGYSGH